MGKMGKKYIFAAVLLAAVMIGGYGCMVMGKIGENLSITDGALKYMEEKYGEKFEYIKAHGAYMSMTSTGMMVSCESFPGKEIYVHIQLDGKERTYRDNYMEYYFAGQVNDLIVGIAKDYFDDVSFEVSILTTYSNVVMDLTTTFEEYLANSRYFISGHMDVGEATEETMREFAAELVRRGFHFSIGIDIPSANEGYSIYYFSEDKEFTFYRRK